jgi:hypothetical protein
LTSKKLFNIEGLTSKSEKNKFAKNKVKLLEKINIWLNYGQVYKKNTTLAYNGNKVSSVSGAQCLLPTSVHCDTHCFQNIGTAHFKKM